MAKNRYTLLLTDAQLEEIDALQEAFNCSTRVGVFEQALGMLKFAATEMGQGNRIGVYEPKEKIFNGLLLNANPQGLRRWRAEFSNAVLADEPSEAAD